MRTGFLAVIGVGAVVYRGKRATVHFASRCRVGVRAEEAANNLLSRKDNRGSSAGSISPTVLSKVIAMLDVGMCAQLRSASGRRRARKAGNVHRYRDFDDAGYVDFLAQCRRHRSRTRQRPVDRLGRRNGFGLYSRYHGLWCSNEYERLGIVLLLAPLAAVPPDEPLRDGVRRLLAALTVADAEQVYEAIRLAAPGGLGRVQDQDVAAAPTQTLREVLALAADRDLIARQYTNAFADVWNDGVPALVEGLRQTVLAGRARFSSPS